MDILKQFTPTNFLLQILWTFIMAALLRAAMWLFEFVPKNESLYWVIFPLLIFGAIAFFRSLGRGVPDKPHLTTKMDAFNMHPFPGDSSSTGMVVVISIRNTGMPTILEEWSITAKRSGQTFRAENLLIPEKLTLHGKGGQLIYWGKDSIYEKAIKDPIVSGGMIRGILQVIFRETELRIIDQPDTSIELRFKDVLGREHVTSSMLSGISGGARHYPGLTLPVEVQ